jgi:hypothetical protein
MTSEPAGAPSGGIPAMGRLETELRAKRAAGRKLLLPYITAG